MESSQTLSYASAIALQKELSPQVITDDQFPQPIRSVAGVDVGFKDHYRITQAAVGVLSFPELEKIESAIAQSPTTFPYIPGLLSFREVPTIIQALEKLETPPDLIICDTRGCSSATLWFGVSPRRVNRQTHDWRSKIPFSGHS